jgi:hypothetical protein
MARSDPTRPIDLLHELLPRSLIRGMARQLGCVQRQREVDAYDLFVAAVMRTPGREDGSIAAIRDRFIRQTGRTIARSAFWSRFSRTFALLVAWCVQHLVTRAEAALPKLTGLLAPFRDVIAGDATVVTVHEALADVWAGTRHAAATKVHTRVRATSGELLRRKITGERVADCDAFGVTWEDTGKLFLLDRGYSSASLWWRIHRVGAFFVTRLPASHKPTIERSLRRHRGRARSLAGKELWDVLDGLRRTVVEVVCPFRIHVNRYGDKKRGRYERAEFRVVGLWNARERCHHVYVTNVRPEWIPAEALRDVYRLRWEVETFYKTAKSGLGLKGITTTKRYTVETLIDSALLRASIAMQARRIATRWLPRGRWIGVLRWVKVWREVIDELLVTPGGATKLTWRRLAHLAMDPNRKRPPTWWRLTDGCPEGT